MRYVVLIHGIRTRGDWQEMVRGVIESDGGVRVRPIKYGRFDLVRFLLLGPTRQGPVKRTKKILSLVAAEARRNNGTLSVIAHSYGTYTISKILAEDRSIELQHLILCGSIVDSDYDWASTRGQIFGRIVNDYGVRDIWPVFARWATAGYDATGTYGFYSNIIEDRLHDCKHSDFFNRDFVDKYWKTLVCNDHFEKPVYECDRIPVSPKYFELLGIRFAWIAIALSIITGSIYYGNLIWSANDSTIQAKRFEKSLPKQPIDARPLNGAPATRGSVTKGSVEVSPEFNKAANTNQSTLMAKSETTKICRTVSRSVSVTRTSNWPVYGYAFGTTRAEAISEATSDLPPYVDHAPGYIHCPIELSKYPEKDKFVGRFKTVKMKDIKFVGSPKVTEERMTDDGRVYVGVGQYVRVVCQGELLVKEEVCD